MSFKFDLFDKETVGTIDLNTKVRVSDPCYDVNTWCAGTLENVMPGTYKCYSQDVDTGDWGIRVASIEVRHEDYLDIEPTELQNIDVGVDSGQAGIYDFDYFVKNRKDINGEDAWYSKVCDKTGGYFNNPDYIPFTQTPTYAAAIMSFRNALDEIKSKYPELDIEKVYIALIDHYNKLEKPVSNMNFDLSDIITTLKDVKEMLSDDYAPPKRTEAEEKLAEIKLNNELLLHKLWNEYKNTKQGVATCWRNIASTLDNKCLVSSSGDGDGSYICVVGRNSEGKIVSIKIDYYPNPYDEDWEDEDELN